MVIDPEDPRGELDPDLVKPAATAEAPERHDQAVPGATRWVATPEADVLPISPIHRHPVLRVVVRTVGLIGLDGDRSRVLRRSRVAAAWMEGPR